MDTPTHPPTHAHTHAHRRLETEPDTPTVQEQLARDLWEAVNNDNVSKVRSVLGQGANPNHQLYWSEEWRTNDRRPPVHRACWRGYLEITRALVSGGADIEKGDRRWGRTAFHWACRGGHMETVVYLSQEMKCRIDVRDEWDVTPLHQACLGGSIQVVKYFVEVLKVDVDVTDVNGKTPLDKAVVGCKTEVIDYLQSIQPSTPEPDTRNGSEQLLSNSIVDMTSSMTSDPLSGQQTPSAGDEQPETIDTQNDSTQLSTDDQTLSSTPLTEEDSDALEKLLLDNKISLTGERTYETVVHHLRELGHMELAANLRENLDKVIKWQRRYLDRLMTLMVDKETIDMCTLKLCLVGPPHVGKTTTLNRLLQVYENIQSAGDKAKHPSTLLANCIQVMALINKDEWISSKDVDEEAKMIFGYLCGNLTLDEIDIPNEESTKATRSEETVPYKVHTQTVQQATLTDSEDKAAVTHSNKLAQVILRLQKLIKSGNYSQMAKCLGNTLLNINDVGGQPEFLEMLPALSNGPAMYLVFLDLSKELDKPYKIPFCRDGKVITPYKSMHTVKTAVSQILSSIASVRHMSEISKPLLKTPQLKEKFEAFLTVPPVAALIGTHKDKLGGVSTDGPEKEKLTRDKLLEINAALKPTTKTFEKILVFPKQESNTSDDTADKDASDRMSFFALDNNKGTENAEISPLRGLLNKLFYFHFGKTSLPISKNWLVLGIILRKEYQIVTVEDCIEIGKRLEMDEEETTICLLYLHSIGSILYYTDVPNDDDPRWLLKGHVICLPQVIFDSISQLIIVSMQNVHGGGLNTEFEVAELIMKGQFTLEAIERHCKLDVEVSKKLKNNLLIPSGPLVKLLKYLNLLSEITHKDEDGERITYLMPAILKCASQDELTKPPQPDTNNPEPLHVTFSFGYVPTGVFCGLITRLVSQGPHGILGLTWELMEDGVKRNYVEFLVAKSNKITLLAHARCYEIRVVRRLCQVSLHDLCTYVLSVMLYTLKSLYPQLVPQIAFQCPCPDHQTSGGMDNLCVLAKDFWVQFLCRHKPVTLRKYQQVWLGKVASIGQKASLCVLKFVRNPAKQFSFDWSKVGDDDTAPVPSKPNTVSFPSVREEDFGHYQCEVKDAAAGKVLLTLYTALYKHQSNPLASGQRKRSLPSDVEVESLSKRPKNDVTVQESSSEKDTSNGGSTHQSIVLTGDDIQAIRESLKNASKDWFNLGLAFGVKINVLENIEDDYRHNDRRLMKVVAKRLEVTDPEHPMTWPYICECLRRPTVARNDVAEEIEDKYVRTATAVAHSATN
ncbi:uncharacterized protein LOC135352042 isoform X4 [Halichondria panicea]|uniref:uncharacterized protein LOC135352042 isoform X4 n=1 Tax=Halichondria panicea TaxID=6063 RepID=UPI00312B952F